MVKAVALLVLVILIVVTVLLGRKIKPYELEQEVIPGVKPYIPSEEIAIFGTRRTRVEEILRQDNPEYAPLEVPADPAAERALAEGDDLWARGQLEAAKASYEAANRLLPNDVTVLLRLAEVEENLGDTGKALDIYHQILDINPEIAEASEALVRLQRQSIRRI